MDGPDADIKVLYSHKDIYFQGKTDKYVMGVTICHTSKDRLTESVQIRTTMPTETSARPELDNDQLMDVTMHEFGHVLSLDDSPDGATDLMGCFDPDHLNLYPSRDEIETVKANE